MAVSKVLVLITHVDMLPENNKAKLKQEIANKFKTRGIPENYILFGEKYCTWDQSKLDKHDKEVKAFFDEIKKNKENEKKDYFEILKEKKKEGAWWLHYSRSAACTKSGCNHNFTTDTIENYKEYLQIVLSNSN